MRCLELILLLRSYRRRFPSPFEKNQQRAKTDRERGECAPLIESIDDSHSGVIRASLLRQREASIERERNYIPRAAAGKRSNKCTQGERERQRRNGDSVCLFIRFPPVCSLLI